MDMCMVAGWTAKQVVSWVKIKKSYLIGRPEGHI